MQLAIAELETKLDILENNEPIHRMAGDVEQADLERNIANDIRKAVKVLQTVTES